MNFFEGLGIFVVALVAFFMFSFLLSAIFTANNVDEWLCLGAWISGGVVYALTVVGLIYISRNGGSL